MKQGKGEEKKANDILAKLQMSQCLKNGLEERLGLDFGGVELSGGQWQRLSIACAWMKDAEIFLFDEATSAIDSMKETEVLNSFLEIAKDRMAIIITHRLSVCPKVNRIICMEEGKIIEEGTHESLMRKQGKYYEMFISQMRNNV